MWLWLRLRADAVLKPSSSRLHQLWGRRKKRFGKGAVEGLGEQKGGAEGVVAASKPQEALGWLFAGVFFPTALDIDVKVLL